MLMLTQARRSPAYPEIKSKSKPSRQAPRFAASLAAALAAIVAGTGCAKNVVHEVCQPGDLSRCIIEDVDIENNDAIGDGDTKDKIATHETSHLLGGVFQNVPVIGILDAV